MIINGNIYYIHINVGLKALKSRILLCSNTADRTVDVEDSLTLIPLVPVQNPSQKKSVRNIFYGGIHCPCSSMYTD